MQRAEQGEEYRAKSGIKFFSLDVHRRLDCNGCIRFQEKMERGQMPSVVSTVHVIQHCKDALFSVPKEKNCYPK